MKNFKLIQLFSLFAGLALSLNSCVNDDDFDIPPTEEFEEFISLGGSAPIFNSCFVEDFESFPIDRDNFDQYENLTTIGTEKWTVSEFRGNKYLAMSSFRSGEKNIAYFVVPVDFDKADVFSFQSQDRFNGGEVLKVFVTTDYTIDEDIIRDATLTDITSSFTIARGTTGGTTEPFVMSGDYSLGGVTGNGFIVFRYEGSDNGITTTMHIDNILIADTDDDACTVNDPVTIGGGGGSAMAQTCQLEDFELFEVDQDLFDIYENVAPAGDQLWRVREFQNNKYIESSAFNGSTVQDEWFLYKVDFDNADTFSFKSKDGFNNGDPLSVLYSNDHVVGENILESTWTDITSSFTIATGTSSGFADNFTGSGDYDLSGISGEGFIAFRYQGGAATITTTIQIDDILVIDNDDTSCDLNSSASCSLQDFSSFGENTTEFSGYQNISVQGASPWEVREFSGNSYIQSSAFNAAGPIENWFILGADFDVAQGFSFSSNHGFDNGAPLSILYSTDYNEMGDPSTAMWTDITNEFTISSGNAGGFAMFETSGEYNLSSLSGRGYIAFQYSGDGAGITTSIQIDDIAFTNSSGSGDCTFDLMPIVVPNSPVLLISELADPNNESGARFVEIYNPGTADVDLTGWALRRWTNGNADPQSTDAELIGMIPAGGTFVVSNNAATFEATYGFAPSQDIGTGGPADSNGDDQIALVNPEGNIVDLFGVPGEDGSGTNHEFEDGRALRNASIMMGNPTYDFSEWMIWNDTGAEGTTGDPQDAPGAFTPGMHPDSGGGGGGSADFELIISGVMDGPLSGGTPKVIELYVGMDIADLSAYGLGSANNGGGTDGQEFTLSGSASAGDYIYISTEEPNFTAFFGFAPNFTDGFASINGDDAIELFKDGAVIDTFGDIAVDGSGQAWEYLDGWAYRNNTTMPGGVSFVVSEWTYSGINALDGETSNATAATPFPIGTYQP